MDRLIVTVFKSLFYTLLLLILSNLIWNITSVLSVHYRILGSVYPLCYAVSDNNRLTDEVRDAYNNIFEDIAAPSGVPSPTIGALGFSPASLALAQAGGEYGDVLQIDIDCIFRVSVLTKGMDDSPEAGDVAGFSGFVAAGTTVSIPVTYTYYVPCLRYYK